MNGLTDKANSIGSLGLQLGPTSYDFLSIPGERLFAWDQSRIAFVTASQMTLDCLRC